MEEIFTDGGGSPASDGQEGFSSEPGSADTVQEPQEEASLLEVYDIFPPGGNPPGDVPAIAEDEPVGQTEDLQEAPDIPLPGLQLSDLEPFMEQLTALNETVTAIQEENRVQALNTYHTQQFTILALSAILACIIIYCLFSKVEV